MATPSKIRNAHFLGTKIRNLRKNNNLTMEDLSARCVKINAESAPSVSYLSMIERGKRHPSETMLSVIAAVFQKDVKWFLDDVPEQEAIVPDRGNRGGISGMALEPSFLFSNDILQIAIPEMLSQTGVSGRQFAHLLIRAHQEHHQNHFPELERAAEAVGKKQLPLSVEALTEICQGMNLQIEWSDDLSAAEIDAMGARHDATVRSYFKTPNIIRLNKSLQKQPKRLKYDLAVYIGHQVLHSGDGVKSPMYAGSRATATGRGAIASADASSAINAQDIVHAWRDFECSFFASALLCPKVAFRRLLERHAHEVNVADIADVSTSVAMRRMTAVSSYSHWHYFDAYPPGRLTAVYRGNGIPLPWGNMRLVQDPCQHWAVFRMISATDTGTSAQISVLDVGDESRIYCCESIKVEDMVGKKHVLCAGVDLNPALTAQGNDAQDVANELKRACIDNGGSVEIPPTIKQEFSRVSRILNIAWLERGIDKAARLICPRSGACPRNPKCHLSL